MGSDSSTPSLTSADTFFSSSDKQYFTLYPEEQVLNQKFSPSEKHIAFFKNKKNFPFSSRMIVNFLLNSQVLTHEKNQFDVFKNILIPSFSQALCTEDMNMIYTKLHFSFNQSLFQFFEDKNKEFIENIVLFSKNNQNKIINDKYLNLKNALKDHVFTSLQQFENMSSKSPVKSKIFMFKFSSKLYFSKNLLSLIKDIFQSNATVHNFSQFLVDSLNWTLCTNELYLTLSILQQLLLGIKKENPNFNQKKLSIVKFLYDQKYPSLGFQIKRSLLNSYINLDSDINPFILSSYSSSIFGATPLFLFVVNNNLSLLRIKISNKNVSNNNEQRFCTVKFKSIFKSGFFLTCANNVVVTIDKNKNDLIYLCNPDPFWVKSSPAKVTNTKNPQIKAPIASDGKYLYSLFSQNKIDIYEVDIDKNCLIFLKRIELSKSDRSQLKEPYDSELIPKIFFGSAAMITNGTTISFIMIENQKYAERKQNAEHFIRTFSLIDGRHIEDYHFPSPFPVNSMCYEPFSRSLWSVSPHNNGAAFIKFDYIGPDPLWLTSAFAFETLLVQQKQFSMKQPKNLVSLVDFLSDYLYYSFIQFWGTDILSNCNDHSSIFAFFIANFMYIDETNNFQKSVDLILDLFQLNNNEKFHQFLFLLLCYQLKVKGKINNDVSKLLYDLFYAFLITKHASSYYQQLLTMFIYLYNNLNKHYCSEFFQLFSNGITNYGWTLITVRLENSKKFPYLIDVNKNGILIYLIEKTYHDLLNKHISNPEFEFLLSYQSSIFHCFSNALQNNPKKIDKILSICLLYTSSMFENCCIFLNSNLKITSSKDNSNDKNAETSILECNFQKLIGSKFLILFNKLIILIQLAIPSTTFTKQFLTINFVLLNFFIGNCQDYFKAISQKNLNLDPFYMFYTEIFYLHSICLKQITSLPKNIFSSKYEQFLNIKMNKSVITLDEIFCNKIKEKDFTDIIELLYNKVTNPLNKKLTKEDKELEQLITLAFVHQIRAQKNFIAIHEKLIEGNLSNIVISPEIRQIIQAVYKIRSNLRSKKQKENQNDYNNIRRNIEEKCNFLLKYNSSKSSNIDQNQRKQTTQNELAENQNFKNQNENQVNDTFEETDISLLKNVSEFLCCDIEISDVLDAQAKYCDVKENLSTFINFANDIISSDIPDEFLYSFIMLFSESSDFLNGYQILSKYAFIQHKDAFVLVQNVLRKMGNIPPNAVISFICVILMMITYSMNAENFIKENHKLLFETFSLTIIQLCQASKTLENQKTIFSGKVVKASISFFCYFHRLFLDERIYAMTSDEGEFIATPFQFIPLKHSLSFILAHSIFHGGFLDSQAETDPLNIINYVTEPKFHGYSLFLYEKLIRLANANKKAFLINLQIIMNNIGSVFCGSSSDLLKIQPPISDLPISQNSQYCKTPTSQIAAALELVQLIRRLLIYQHYSYNNNVNVSKLVSEYFVYLNDNFDSNNQNLMKQIFAMLVIMSNVIDVVRPNTIVTTAENKSYFVLKMNEKDDELFGILLPFNSPQLIIHKLSLATTLKCNELIPFSLSVFSDVLSIPFSLFKKAIKMTQMTKYSDWLFTFFALRCVRENILDPEKGLEFSTTLLDIIKNKYQNEGLHNSSILNNFVFRSSAPIVLNLLKKSLMIPNSEGIFVGSPVKPKFFHTSYTHLVFQKDYKLTENTMEAKTGAHVFISSILDDSNAVYFSVKIFKKERSNPIHVNFGVTTFSVDQNQSISITYSSVDNSYYINGASCYASAQSIPNDCPEDILLECRYLPIKNKIAFALSSFPRRLFSCKLPPNSRCSFIALVFPHTTVEYICTFSPQTDCFQKNLHLYQIATPFKFIKRIGTNLFKSSGKKPINENMKKFSMLTQRTIDDKKEEIIKYSKLIVNAGKNKTDLITASEDTQNATSNTATNVADFAILNIHKTAFSLCAFHDSSYVSQYPHVYSSPLKLRNFITVSEVSGEFDIIPSYLAMTDSENIIPPFHFDNYYHIPIELINCYFSGVCEMHRKEILTLLLAKNFSSSLSPKYSSSIKSSFNLSLTLQAFSISPKMIVDFVVSVLFLLEPIKITNLLENKSPIDFESFNSFENCYKMDLYDYFSGLTKILNYINENISLRQNFIYNWFCKIENCFKNKYMHFVCQTNSSVIVSDLNEINTSDIYNNKQDFFREKADGWITIPLTFGLRVFPTSIKINKLIFPQSRADSATYAYSTGEMLRIFKNGSLVQKFAFLPFYSNSNESLFNSFFDFAVSFKYFVLFISKYNQSNMNGDNNPDNNNNQDSNNNQDDKNNWNNTNNNELHSYLLRTYVLDSIIAGSPFFFTHSDAVLHFLNSKLPVIFTPEYISRLNMFIIAAQNIKHEYVQQFILENISLFDDMKSLIYKYFIDDSIKPPLLNSSKNKDDSSNLPLTAYKIELPDCFVPKILKASAMNSSSFLIAFKRILINNNEPNVNENQTIFPYHLVLNEWSESFILYPPCDIQFLQSNIISITFLSYIPNTFQLIDRDIDEYEPILVSFVNPVFENNYFDSKINSISLKGMPKTANKIYIKFKNIENMKQHNLIVFNNNSPRETALIAYQNREIFKKDITEEWSNNFTDRDDQMILVKIDPEIFENHQIKTRLEPVFISALNTETHRPHMIYLRAIYLIAFNFICCQNPSVLTDSKNHLIATLQPFLSLRFSINEFRQFVHTNCQSYQSLGNSRLSIDRQTGVDVRNGINKDLSKSMIAQFSSFHLKNKKYFMNEEAPFHISFKKEKGVDCGGLMREFVSELIKDIHSPRIGLFVKTPNFKNHEGRYQDSIIPVPDPNMSPSQSSNYYKSIGALIAMGIRNNIKQPDLIFPPLFWNFMVKNNSLKINDIFDIDLAYKNQIKSLLENQNTMNEQQFKEYSASVVILNSRGNIIYSSSSNLQSGHIKSRNVMNYDISKENCERFVNLCNEARITELLNPLEMIRFGFWENLNGNIYKDKDKAVQIPRYVSPQLLEFLVCGEKLIDITLLKELTTFQNFSSQQKKYFWEAVGQMTNEQRKKLLQFSTGLTTISQQNGLRIDLIPGPCDSRLPTASTCFFNLHLPQYSSSEKMFRALIYAINESGTFENS